MLSNMSQGRAIIFTNTPTYISNPLLGHREFDITMIRQMFLLFVEVCQMPQGGAKDFAHD